MSSNTTDFLSYNENYESDNKEVILQDILLIIDNFMKKIENEKTIKQKYQEVFKFYE